MKTTLLFTLLMLGLGSCTETIYEEIFKTDTVWIDKPRQSIAPTIVTVIDTVEIHTIDTVSIEVVVHDVDTLIQYVTKDSIIVQTVEKIIEHRDTVVVHDVDTVVITLHDTTYIEVVRIEQRIIYTERYSFPGQSVFYFPDNLLHYYQEFVADAQARNVQINGGDIVCQYVPASDLAGEGWVSDSWYLAGDQWVISLSDQLLEEHSKAAIYRELGRIQLKKKYSNDVTRIMSPLFRTSPDPTASEINTLFQ